MGRTGKIPRRGGPVDLRAAGPKARGLLDSRSEGRLNDEDYRRFVRINLPHARTIVARVGRTLDALGAFGEGVNGGAIALHAAFDSVEQSLRSFDEDPAPEETISAADAAAEKARALVEAILETPARSDRLGQHVLRLAEEAATLSLECGERPDSFLR